MRPGPLIAIYVGLLYSFLAPLVLFGIFVLFDALNLVSSKEPNDETGTQHPREKDPAVWNADDIAVFQEQD
jgi:hypothetical protein